MSLNNFFNPGSVAVIGVSESPSKVGHVIFKNLADGSFHGKVFAVNPNLRSVLNHPGYSSVLKIKDKIDLAIIAIPASKVMEVVKECNRKNIKNLLIISSGFGEVGNHALEERLRFYLERNKIKAVGVNCLGIYDAHSGFDSLFLPRYKVQRPDEGSIGFICQSGAVGSAILDMAASKGHRFSKFVSYGNATQTDESDLLEYLGNDVNTEVICMYIEGIKDGEKFFRIAKRVAKKKPVIVIKGGLTKEGSKAALSHTGSMAGEKEVYFGVFRQTGVIRADSLEEMFDIASLFEKGVKDKGRRFMVITNGGGYGIISTDNISKSECLKMAELSPGSKEALESRMPDTVNIRNPLDLVGDAGVERYRDALDVCLKDKNVDGIVLVILYQLPLIHSEITDLVIEARRRSGKPIIVVSTGGNLTEELSDYLEDEGIPTFSYPENAVKALDKLIWYENKKKFI